ncbi:MAG TPA: hypothetical protein VGC47_05965 [Acidimicrobiia bacterium]|jgi:hypothetical protein
MQRGRAITRTLGADQAVRNRPFTSPSLYGRDLTILGYILEDLRTLVGEARRGVVTVAAHSPVEWTVHGLRRRTIVCELEPLARGTTLCVVGFFGDRHPDRDLQPLEDANADIVLEFRNFPGILSYSSMELPDGNWANLVLHDVPESSERWRQGERHARASTELAPQYYRSVRIHTGTLPGGVVGTRPIELSRTKYWDFTSPRPWQAVRELSQPIVPRPVTAPTRPAGRVPSIVAPATGTLAEPKGARRRI